MSAKERALAAAKSLLGSLDTIGYDPWLDGRDSSGECEHRVAAAMLRFAASFVHDTDAHVDLHLAAEELERE